MAAVSGMLLAAASFSVLLWVGHAHGVAVLTDLRLSTFQEEGWVSGLLSRRTAALRMDRCPSAVPCGAPAEETYCGLGWCCGAGPIL